MTHRLTTFAALAVTTLATANAHPGHGEPGQAHYVTEPTHVVPVMLAASVTLVVVAAVALWRRGKTVRQLEA